MSRPPVGSWTRREFGKVTIASSPSPSPSRARLQGVRPPVIDRLPPQNLDSEQAVLGPSSSTATPSSRSRTSSTRRISNRQAHGRIYVAMLDLFEHREPIDVVTVAEALERAGELDEVGGAS